jgi:predicted transcriptional regulator
MSVKTLIDKASNRVGSRIKLAAALGVGTSTVYDWEYGTRTCSPADRARLAGFAGEDAVQELVRATLETARGDVRKDQLQKLLGKSLRAIGVALGTVLLAPISLTSGPAEAASYFIRCILC